MEYNLIDTLAHPTLTGKWLGRDIDCSFSKLSSDLNNSPFKKAFAIGMYGLDGYNHKDFIKECSKYNNLIPIAGFDPMIQSVEVGNELRQIKELGYKGIKIHPRFSKFNYDKDLLKNIFNLAYQNNLIVFYCTYSHCSAPDYPEQDPLYTLAAAINSCPDIKLILVHGGDVNILKYAELARFNKNILLDLSLTLMKYKGSSIDNDLKFLFRNFDRKITIGTDYPEYTHNEVFKRVYEFSIGLSQEKIDNICYKNICLLAGNLLY
mgnify:FL=1